MYLLTSVQEASLRLLYAFDAVCRELGLRYWLTGGTLLGAIRHKGFIPWDDDIDIMMLRADYDRLARYLESKPIPGTFWESGDSFTHKTTIHLHGKICLSDQSFKSCENDLFHFGIDVFPLDYLSDDFFVRMRQYIFSSFYKHLLPLLFGGTSGRHHWVKLVVSFLLRPFFKDAGKIVELYRKSIVRSSMERKLYSGSGRYGWKLETFPVDWFEETTDVLFEGGRFPIPGGANDFLFQVYGNGCLSVTDKNRSSPHYRVDLGLSLGGKPKISFILATCKRVVEVAEWVKTVKTAAEVAGVMVQLIIADQNDDDRLNPVLECVPESWDFEHVKIDRKGVCLARNAVLDRITGDIVAFPDDDCLYSPYVLMEIFKCFRENVMTDVVVGVTAKSVNFSETDTGRKKIGRYSLFRHAEMYLQFYRREVLNSIGMFDEDFGPGEVSKYPYGGDDSDYLARAVKVGLSVIRLSSAQVWHPQQDAEGFDVCKIKGYGRTRMALLRKLGYPFWFKVANVSYPLLMIVRHPMKFRYYFAMFRGRMSFLL